ncbi:hypothetical protein [Oleidesulfovibrio alaskensis]|jgi:hypothetical protein
MDMTAAKHMDKNRSNAVHSAPDFRLLVAPQTGRPAPPEAVRLQCRQLRGMWRELEKMRLTRTVFHDGCIRSAQDFISMATSPAVWFYGVYGPSDAEHCTAQKRAAAFFWLNAFSGRTAMIHFAVLYGGLRHAEHIGRQVCGFLLGRRRHTACETPYADSGTTPGTAPLDALMGLTPCRNRRALRFIRRLGFMPVATLPGAVRQGTGYGDAVLTMLTAASGAADNIMAQAEAIPDALHID